MLEEPGLLGFLVSEERKLTTWKMEATAAFQASLGSASKHCTEVQSDYVLGSNESTLCHGDKPQHHFSLSGRDVLEACSASRVLVCWGACRPSGGAVAVIAGGGEE